MTCGESKLYAHCYLVYGLTITSEVPLPELVRISKTKNTTVDVWVRLAAQAERGADPSDWFLSCPLPDGSPWLSCAKTQEGYLLRFFELADFSVDTSGHKICCYALPQTSPVTIRHLLLDQVLPLVLNLRGQEVLHATAVLTQVGVCAFTGLTGTGKSTLAANFLHAGFSAFSDDCLVIEEKNNQVCAVPAYPGLRLWDDALQMIRSEPGQLAPVAHYTAKRRIVFEDTVTDFPIQPQPMAGIYSLVRHNTMDETDKTNKTNKTSGCVSPQIERLSWREAYAELLPHLFRFDITDRHMLKRQFEWLGGVVEKVPVCRLTIPAGFELLDTVRMAVLADLSDCL